MADELNKQTEVLQSETKKDKNGIAKAALVISIVTMLGVIADIVVQLFSITVQF